VAVRAVAPLAVALVVLAAGCRGGSSRPSESDVADAMRAAGCTYRSYAVPAPAGGSMTLPSSAARGAWATTPPSAGPHAAKGSVLAFYGRPLQPAPIVKNLEDGVVVLWYGEAIAPSYLHRLEDFYQESPAGMLGSPYPSLGGRVALAAWTGDPGGYGKDGDWGEGHLAVCPAFDAAAFRAFRDAFRARGPGGKSLGDLQPAG
jgi:hypothetical protein